MARTRTSKIPPGFAYESILHLPTARAYLRSFAKEPAKWNELIEATLTYGIHCLTSNYSLHGMRIQDVQDIAGKILKPSYHYHVRQPQKSSSLDEPRLGLRKTKPSIRWREGEKTHILKAKDIETQNDGDQEVVMPTNLRSNQVKREIDIYRSLLGEDFLEYMLKYFGKLGYPMQSVTIDRALTAYTGFEFDVAEKLPQMPTSTSMSFVQFVRGYLQHCVVERIETEREKRTSSVKPKPTWPKSKRQSKIDGGRLSRSHLDYNPPSNQLSKNDSNQKGRSSTKLVNGLPEYLHKVKSKVGPALEQRKRQHLRVRKNQTQRLKESIARERLKEYSKRSNETKDKSTFSHSKNKKASKRHPPGEHLGESAGEIATSFADGELMKKLQTSLLQDEGEEDGNANNNASKAEANLFELYGSTGMNDPIGCVVAATRRREREKKKPEKHAYTGWLGDFGLPHTHTIKPQDTWDVDNYGENESDDDSVINPRNFGASEIDWDFDEIEREASHRLKEQQIRFDWESDGSSENDTLDRDDTREANGLEALYTAHKSNPLHTKGSDEEIEADSSSDSDPAFSWLRQYDTLSNTTTSKSK